MRLLASILLLASSVIIFSSWQTAHAAQTDGAYAPSTLREYAAQPIDDHDESRVTVQLVVAGAAAGLVVGVGAAAYFLRRKLGLTAYSPDDSGGAGHH